MTENVHAAPQMSRCFNLADAIDWRRGTSAECKMTDETKQWLEDWAIDEVEALVPDIAGVARGKFFPADKFLKHTLRIPESVFLQGITGDYGEIETDRYDIDPDLELVPDYSTLRKVPWT